MVHTVIAGPIRLELIDFGARIVSVTMPDRHDRIGSICLGLPSLEDYEDRSRNFFLGDTIGRFANRIAGARFSLDGEHHELEANDGPNHLHGGPGGLGWRVWESEPFMEDDSAGVVFRTLSPDGEGGYPGALHAESRITLAEAGTITFDYSATTDRPTVVGLTNHTYWNLAGSGTIRDHIVTIAADRYLPVDDGIPTDAAPAPVSGTLDLRTGRRVGEVIDALGGIDHCYVPAPTPQSRPQVSVEHPQSGRRLQLWTDQPGIQCYTGQFLGGSGHPPFGGLCLEPQQLPDAPNRPDFPSPVLRPGDTYRARTEIRLTTDD